MSHTWKCNSCGGVYSDTLSGGTAYYHSCPLEKIEPAITDAQGNVTTPEKRTPFQNRRDERPAPGIEYVEGKPYKNVPHPEERGRTILVPGEPSVVSEGLGRTLVE